jgi:hypothetical protein
MALWSNLLVFLLIAASPFPLDAVSLISHISSKPDSERNDLYESCSTFSWTRELVTTKLVLVEISYCENALSSERSYVL